MSSFTTVSYVRPARRAHQNMQTLNVLNALAHSVLKFGSVYFDNHTEYCHELGFSKHDLLKHISEPAVSQNDADLNSACNELAQQAVTISRRSPSSVNSRFYYPTTTDSSVRLFLGLDTQLPSSDVKALNQASHLVRSSIPLYPELRLNPSHFGPKRHQFLSPRVSSVPDTKAQSSSALAELNRMAKVYSIVSDFDKSSPRRSSNLDLLYYPEYTPVHYSFSRSYSRGFPNPFVASVLKAVKLDKDSSFSKAFPSTQLDISQYSMVLGRVDIAKEQFNKLLAFKLGQIRTYLSTSSLSSTIVPIVKSAINRLVKISFETKLMPTLASTRSAKGGKKHARKAKKQTSAPQEFVPSTEPVPQVEEPLEEFDLSSPSDPLPQEPPVSLSQEQALDLVSSDPDTHIVASIFSDRSTSGRDLSDLRHTLRVIRAKLTLFSCASSSSYGRVVPGPIVLTHSLIHLSDQCGPANARHPNEHLYNQATCSRVKPHSCIRRPDQLVASLLDVLRPFHSFFGFDFDKDALPDLLVNLKSFQEYRLSPNEFEPFTPLSTINEVFTSLELAVASCSGFF